MLRGKLKRIERPQFHSRYFFECSTHNLFDSRSRYESEHCSVAMRFHFWFIVFFFIATPFSNTIDFNWDTKIGTSNATWSPKNYVLNLMRTPFASVAQSSFINWLRFFFGAATTIHPIVVNKWSNEWTNNRSRFANIPKTNGFIANQSVLNSSHLLPINENDIYEGWKTVYFGTKKIANE